MNAAPELLPLPDRNPADAAVARRLIATQFPRWSHLQIRDVDVQGWDNRTFRLGDDMLVRLPTAEEYALAVAKEHRWLPILASVSPVEIPVPVARGVPDAEFPHDWSVYRWIDGEPVNRVGVEDLTRLAVDVADFLTCLRGLDATDGPGAGLHNWYRGGPLTTYDGWARASLETLSGVIETEAAEDIWEQARGSSWDGRPIWFHGDIAPGNLLVKDGALSAVIDFGTCGTGDPACDLAIAWTTLTGDSRAAFRDRMAVDDGTWLRGQGWALWKALVVCAGSVRDGEGLPADEAVIIEEIVAAHR